MTYFKMPHADKQWYLTQLRSGEFQLIRTEYFNRQIIPEMTLSPAGQHSLAQPYQGDDEWEPINGQAERIVLSWLHFKYKTGWTYYDVADWIELNL